MPFPIFFLVLLSFWLAAIGKTGDALLLLSCKTISAIPFSIINSQFIFFAFTSDTCKKLIFYGFYVTVILGMLSLRNTRMGF